MITILLKKMIYYLTIIAHKDSAPVTEDITDQVTLHDDHLEENTTVYSVKKMGHLVEVNIGYMKNMSTINTTELILSGLPKPIHNVSPYLWDYNYERFVRLRLNTNGELLVWYTGWNYSRPARNIFTYITEE